MIVIYLLLTISTLFYIWLKWNYSYWERNKVPGPKPTLLIGNMGSTLTFSQNFADLLGDLYKKYTDVPYVGFYKMLRPSILLRDPDLIKAVLITDFQTFRKNLTMSLSEKYDKLMLVNPFYHIDDKWKEIRKSMAPLFSSSKIRSLYPVMNSVGERLSDFIKSHEAKDDFDAKELSLRFATENMVKTIFSIDSYSFVRNQDSEFMKAGKVLFDPSTMVSFKNVIAPVLPQWILEILPIPLVPKEIQELLERVMAENRASRSDDHQSNDFYHTLLQFQEKQNLPDIYVTGHTYSLFVEGTEASSTLSYVLYELAANPQCQEKLCDEIVQILAAYSDEIEGTDAVHKSEYFDAIILETLRIHSASMWIAKICMQKYQLPKNRYQTEPLTIHPGMVVHIPIQSIQMDEKYYPNPTEFRPERFMGDENKNRHKGVYLPFSEGPRSCSGMRFSMAHIKIALTHIVKSYRVKLSPKQKPIVIDPKAFLSYPKDGILVRFEAR